VTGVAGRGAALGESEEEHEKVVGGPT